MRIVFPLAVTASLMLASCQAPTNQQMGAVGGSAVGAMVGNQFGSGAGRVGATVLGAGVGGIVGGNIGRGMDQRSAERARQAERQALESGRAGTPVAWSHQSNHGEIIPGPPRQVNGRECRDFTHRVWIGGRQEVASGTSCRQPDGTWRPLA